MIRNLSRRRERLLLCSDESGREVIAAWLLVLFFVAAGLSIVAIHRSDVADCPTMAALPGIHYHFTADQEWDDPACSIGACGNTRSAQEIDRDGVHAAESDSGESTPVYSGSSTPASLQRNGGDQDERLC